MKLYVMVDQSGSMEKEHWATGKSRYRTAVAWAQDFVKASWCFSFARIFTFDREITELDLISRDPYNDGRRYSIR